MHHAKLSNLPDIDTDHLLLRRKNIKLQVLNITSQKTTKETDVDHKIIKLVVIYFKSLLYTSVVINNYTTVRNILENRNMVDWW